MRATGVCATDLKIVSGAFHHIELPLVPGHEVAGELAEPAGSLEAGERVACALYDSCGACVRRVLCLPRGQADSLPARRAPRDRAGRRAGRVRSVPVDSLLPFGDSVGYATAAVAMDAVTTPWRALHGRAELRGGETVAVVGAGGLGLNAIKVAREIGARVAAIELNAERRELALGLGAELAVAPAEVAGVRDWAGEGVDAALETSGVSPGFETALDALRRGGRLVSCGYRPGLDLAIDSARLVLDEIALFGSRTGSRADARAALAAIEPGRIEPTIMETLPLERVNEALDRLRGGDAIGRLVIDMTL